MPITKDEEKELKGIVTEVFQEQIKEAEERAKAREEKFWEEFSKKSQEEKSDITKRIEAIESLPIVKRSVAIPGGEGARSEVYLGHKVEKAFVDIFKGDRCPGAQSLVVNPKAFPIIADDEKRGKMAKHLLMIVKASLKDHRAVKDYQDWAEKASNENPIIKAAMAEGTGSTGGYLVPDEFSDEILAFARLKSVALQDCRIWPMGTDVKRVPAENAKVSVGWKAEASDADQTDPTFNEIVLTAKRLTAFSVASNELLNDSSVDIVSYLTEIFSEAIGQELDNQVFNGTGDPWSGVLTAAAGYSVVMTGLANFSSISGDNLADLIDKIPQEAEDGAKYYFHKNILTYIRKLKDTTNQYLFAPISGGLPADIWSYPYVRTPKCPAASATGTGKAFVSFGNLRHFALGRRLESMTLDLDPYGLFKSYRSQFRIVQRWGGAMGLANAFSRLVTG